MLSASVIFTGCAGHVTVGYRAYDPYYTDYHVWGPPEFGFYNQWEVENHYRHRDFKRRPESERRAYWTWRHAHPDARR